VLSKY
jgi:hypothetical protein